MREMLRGLTRRKHRLAAITICGVTATFVVIAAFTWPIPPFEGNLYEKEAHRLTTKTLATFWHEIPGMFKAPVRDAEAVPSDLLHDKGYTLWPTADMFLAVIDAARASPAHYSGWIHKIYACMEKYYDASEHAYNAWLTFPGNNDKYYDDNSLVVMGLVQAHEITGNAAYLNRAHDVFSLFIAPAWDGGSDPGGLRWGTFSEAAPHTDRGACTATLAACAALYLARNGRDATTNVNLAKVMLGWVKTTLQDSADGLVRDRLINSTGTWVIEPTKWTYNTGNYILGNALLYQATSNESFLDDARAAAAAAMNRSRLLYDSLVVDHDVRYWWDASFFVQHLIDGLVHLHAITNETAIMMEINRNVDYAMMHLNDTTDGLYWRNWRLWTIDAERHAAWESMTGQVHPLVLDPAERSMENTVIPVEERPLVKTLLGNAGACRVLWLAGRVNPW